MVGLQIRRAFRAQSLSVLSTTEKKAVSGGHPGQEQEESGIKVTPLFPTEIQSALLPEPQLTDS